MKVVLDTNALLISIPRKSNVKLMDVFFHWDLIKNDPDDNKFVDAAISGNCDFIVTNDRHFDLLEDVEFPLVKIKSISDFMKLLQTSGK